jgi:hypothetical protein
MSREYDSKIVSDNTEGFVSCKQKPNYTMTFSHEGKFVGELDWNNHPATFTGDMDGSARVFFDYLIQVWPSLLDEAVQKAMPVVSAGQPGWQLREVYFDEDLMPTAYRAPQHSGMVSGWRTIDKPPTEEDGYVLVWAENMPVSVGCWEEDYYIFTDCRDFHNDFEGDVNWLKEHWSHWMPLPDPKSKQHSGMVSVPVEVINRFPKLDMDDYYSHADVCALNEWGVELVLAAQEQQ